MRILLGAALAVSVSCGTAMAAQALQNPAAAIERPAPAFTAAAQEKAANCRDSGDRCSWDSDCCSGNCWGGECQSGNGSCRDSGERCSWDSDCCTNNCWGGECQSSKGLKSAAPDTKTSASLWKSAQVTVDGPSAKVAGRAPSAGRDLRPGETLRASNTGAFCSGVLISEDLLLTGSRCVIDKAGCADSRILLGGKAGAAEHPGASVIPSGEVFGCAELVALVPDAGGAPGYALLRLDRKAAGRAPAAAPALRGGPDRARDARGVVGIAADPAAGAAGKPPVPADPFRD
ncbi:MAG: hypothetical protein ACYC2I_02135 [Elusimicrobiales bacterium]